MCFPTSTLVILALVSSVSNNRSPVTRPQLEDTLLELPENLGWKSSTQIRVHKPYPISDQNGQNPYHNSERNRFKTLPFGAAHTYIGYIWEYSLGVG